MNLSDYQVKAWGFAMYPGAGYNNLEYPTLGLTGEAGEIANKVKKVQRDNRLVSDVRDDLASELGDVLWYVAALATELGLDLDDLAYDNLQKLNSRAVRGVIGGSGDNR
jgi:NTP pyrophosphatase (non-canonical NTP hydrolase)